MRIRLLVTSFCIIAFIPISQQCGKGEPPDRSLITEQEKARKQELELWCFNNCASEWTLWTPCEAKCGKGLKTRSRKVELPAWCKLLDGFNCSLSLKQSDHCNAGCPYGGIPSNNSCSSCQSSRKGDCCEIEIFCPFPSGFKNGKVRGNWPATTHSMAEFTCNVGYNLDGDDIAICDENSTWSIDPPKCKSVICYQPPNNVSTVQTLNPKPGGYAFGEQVFYDCEDGYTLIGEKSRTCQKDMTGNGSWSGYDVRCKPVNCPVPTIPENGKIKTQLTSFQYKDVIPYSCHEGYKLIGSDVLICLASGSWLGREPQCEVISCEPPFTPRHGQVRIRKAGIRAFALFECDEGYRLEPSVSLLMCTYAGTWNGTEPKCIASSCGDPGSPIHGYKDGGMFTYGNKVTFHCERGYEMKGGSQTMECQSNTQWSGTMPVCEACQIDFFMEDERCKKCPANSHTMTNASTSVVQCLCDREKGFVGPPGGPCEELFCTVLKAPDNGAISECGNKVGASCNFTCNDGFVVERGSTKRTCQNTGDWDGTTAFCIPCKLNTYKSGERTCSPCPIHSHTEVPAQMKTGCICDKGYHGPAGGPCLDVNECEENAGKGPCKDTCENNDGGFHCRCSIPGYKISQQDPLTCIAEEQCRNLTRNDAPKNGGVICHWYYEENAQHCTTKCNPGFELPSRTNDYETCGPTTGYEWSYQVINSTAVLAPCIPEFFPEFRLEGETAYFAAACEDLTEVQKTAAKEEFAKRLNDNGVCSKRETKICNIKDMGIICGRTTRRRRRRGVDVLEHSVDFAYNVSALKFEDKTTDCHDKICPMLRIPPEYCDQYCKPTYKRYLKASVEFARRQLLDIHKDKNKMRRLAFKVDSLQFIAEKDGFRASDVIKECPQGMAAIDDQCVPCRAGTYLNEVTNECLVCPRHTFQDKDQQTFCIPCKTIGPGYSTSGNGSAICQMCSDGNWGEDCAKHCDCVRGSCSPFNGECICPSGWEGDRCEKNINSCVEGSCYPGVTCIDEPPPSSGFSCGACPSGYQGDGISCTPLLKKEGSNELNAYLNYDSDSWNF